MIHMKRKILPPTYGVRYRHLIAQPPGANYGTPNETITEIGSMESLSPLLEFNTLFPTTDTGMQVLVLVIIHTISHRY
jgi:hypothetical protein